MVRRKGLILISLGNRNNSAAVSMYVGFLQDAPA